MFRGQPAQEVAISFRHVDPRDQTQGCQSWWQAPLPMEPFFQAPKYMHFKLWCVRQQMTRQVKVLHHASLATRVQSSTSRGHSSCAPSSDSSCAPWHTAPHSWMHQLCSPLLCENCFPVPFAYWFCLVGGRGSLYTAPAVLEHYGWSCLCSQVLG